VEGEGEFANPLWTLSCDTFPSADVFTDGLTQLVSPGIIIEDVSRHVRHG